MPQLLTGNLIEVKGVEILNLYPNTHKLEFTDKDLDQIIANFKQYRKQFKPNVKMSHSGQQLILKEMFKKEDIELGEELPSLGLITNMYKKGQSLYADLENVPETIWNKAIKMFKAVSPEILMNFRGTGKKFIRAISLTNNPSLQHIGDVFKGGALCFSGDFNIIKEEIIMPKDKDGLDIDDATPEVVTKDDLKSLSDSILESVKGLFKKKADKPEDKVVTEVAIQGVSMSDFAELRDQMILLSEKNNELSGNLLKKDSDFKKLSESINKVEENARIKTADAICMSAMQSGVPAVVVNHFKPLLHQEVSKELITLSAVVDEKEVKTEKTVSEYVEEFFSAYPNKLKMSDTTRTTLVVPGAEDDKQDEEIAKLTEKYEGQGMATHEALEKAGLEVLGKGV